MRPEKEKMLAGELYDALDPELIRARERARDLCHDLNAGRDRDHAVRRRILSELFGSGGNSVWMQSPFYCDYGSNIYLGELRNSGSPFRLVQTFGWRWRDQLPWSDDRFKDRDRCRECHDEGLSRRSTRGGQSL